MQREDEEEEKMGQREGTKGGETIPTDDWDEPMKNNEGKAASREDELAFEEATNGRDMWT